MWFIADLHSQKPSDRPLAKQLRDYLATVSLFHVVCDGATVLGARPSSTATDADRLLIDLTSSDIALIGTRHGRPMAPFLTARHTSPEGVRIDSLLAFDPLEDDDRSRRRASEMVCQFAVALFYYYSDVALFEVPFAIDSSRCPHSVEVVEGHSYLKRI